MNDDHLSSGEAATVLRVTRKEVQRLCRAGALDCHKDHAARWLITRASVLAYIARLADKNKPS